MSMFLDFCQDGHDGCVVYSCEPDGWATHLPDDNTLLSRLNGSYDTFDRRTGTMLSAADYPSQVLSDAGADGVAGTGDDTSSRSWWKPWAR